MRKGYRWEWEKVGRKGWRENEGERARDDGRERREKESVRESGIKRV